MNYNQVKQGLFQKEQAVMQNQSSHDRNLTLYKRNKSVLSQIMT
jgi:hypothetical protein